MEHTHCWMLLSSAVIHLLFYGLGFIAVADVRTLHERGIVGDIFFSNGLVLFSILISVLLIVVWLIHLFKNNSFKNLYPTSRLKLFSQFLLYFIIVISSTTFYYSYNLGLKNHINLFYPDNEFKVEVETSNQAALFFSQNLEKYTINNRKYPAPLDTLFCEHRYNYVNNSLPYLKFLNKAYQFYTLNKKISDIGID